MQAEAIGIEVSFRYAPQRIANASTWPSKALIRTSGRMPGLVSYQPRPIFRRPFCHTRIPVEDPTWIAAAINEIGQLSDTR